MVGDTSGAREYSVVVPLFNKRASIDRALDSVLAQGHVVEIVVVDDGSTDDGAEIVEQRSDPRIRLVRQSNQGVSAARNRGVKESRNELIAFLDADDEWLPGFLDTIDALIELYPSAGAYTTSYQETTEGRTRTIRHPSLPHPFTGTPYYFRCVRHGDYFCTPTIVVRKAAMQDINGFNNSSWLWEDSDAWGRLVLKGYDIAHSTEVGAVYHKEGSNHALKRGLPAKAAFIESAVRHMSEHPGSEDEDLLAYINRMIYLTARRNVFHGHNVLAREIIADRPSNKMLGKLAMCYCLTYIPPRVAQRTKELWFKFGLD